MRSVRLPKGIEANRTAALMGWGGVVSAARMRRSRPRRVQVHERSRSVSLSAGRRESGHVDLGGERAVDCHA